MPVVVGFSPWCVSLDAGVAADGMPDVRPAASRAFAIAAPPVGNVRGVSLSVATDAIYNIYSLGRCLRCLASHHRADAVAPRCVVPRGLPLFVNKVSR